MISTSQCLWRSHSSIYYIEITEYSWCENTNMHFHQSGPGSNGNERVTLHFPGLQNWSLTFRCSLVSGYVLGLLVTLHLLLQSHIFNNMHSSFGHFATDIIFMVCFLVSFYLTNSHSITSLHGVITLKSCLFWESTSVTHDIKCKFTNCAECLVSLFFDNLVISLQSWFKYGLIQSYSALITSNCWVTYNIKLMSYVAICSVNFSVSYMTYMTWTLNICVNDTS